MVERFTPQEQFILDSFSGLESGRQLLVYNELSSLLPHRYNNHELAIINAVRHDINANKFRAKTKLIYEYALDLIESKGKDGAASTEFKEILARHSNVSDLDQGVFRLVSRLKDKFHQHEADLIHYHNSNRDSMYRVWVKDENS